MWTSLSANRRVGLLGPGLLGPGLLGPGLLGLAVVMLCSASRVDSYVPIVGLSCCRSVSSRRMERIKACYEQEPREGCNRHAFLIITKKKKQWCINPDAPWLKNKIETGKLDCPPDLVLLNGGPGVNMSSEAEKRRS